MKFTLKDYQDDAVKDVLTQLRKARRRWHDDGDKVAFSLTATTGAGKTVMAAAVFESLFYGNEDYVFESDPGAVVIWFSDDPSLNTQSRWRLLEASDKLTITSLEEVDTSFNREKLEAGKIYFLNTQKLGRNSLLVRGSDPTDTSLETVNGQRVMPDMRSYTMWDTIQNTIEDPALTLYLVLDEAHRGMRGATDGRSTIVKQLINGAGSVPGIPIVWGISATVERFDDAIRGMQGRGTLPNVVVDPAKVQESGLLKDTINLDIPDETGDFSTVLLRRGTEKFKDITEAWATYAQDQGTGQSVLPLMVVQVPNSPDHNEIGTWLDTIFATWPELPRDSVANVFGEHRTETFGSHSVSYIQPERVQESKWVRVLVAKDAISTGWDCPRAEVMVSFRAATDKTHITQLLGRMVRTPLARRIPGNERLNAVDCLLPKFDRKQVVAVVDSLMHGGDDEGSGELPGRRVLINPREMTLNKHIPEEVWDKLLSLPSQTLPKRQARPVKRLTILAHELAADALMEDAGKKAHAELHRVLDSLVVRYADDIEKARDAVMEVVGQSVRADVETGKMTFNAFVEAADYAVIENAYKRAGRIISPDLARSYSEYLAEKAGEGEDTDEALIDAHTAVAALGLVPDFRERLDAEAEALANSWINKHRVEIKGLSDERQDVYREIQAMSAHPLDVTLAKPTLWLQQSASSVGGAVIPLPTYEKHLLSDANGKYPADLNEPEKLVIATELQRPATIGWYRNPPRSAQESLGIVYEKDGVMSILRPDFIFFTKTSEGKFVADIVDPHGAYLSDALPKLKGLASFAERHATSVRRVETIDLVGGKYRVLDLTDGKVRDAIRGATSATALYESQVATDYLP